MKILNSLQDWERLTVADALESVSFEKGDCIGKLLKLVISSRNTRTVQPADQNRENYRSCIPRLDSN